MSPHQTVTSFFSLLIHALLPVAVNKLFWRLIFPHDADRNSNSILPLQRVAMGNSGLILLMQRVASGNLDSILPLQRVTSGNSDSILPLQRVASGNSDSILPLQRVADSDSGLIHPILHVETADLNSIMLNETRFKEKNKLAIGSWQLAICNYPD